MSESIDSCTSCNHHHSENDNDNDNEVKFKIVEEMRNRSIILDDEFDGFIQLTQRLLVEVDEKPEKSDNLILLAETIMCADNVISDMDFMNFKWAYSTDSSSSIGMGSVMTEERLKELNLSNNLDSVIGYCNGFNLPDYMTLGLIGGICHKMGNVSEIIVHSPDGPQEKSTFYLKIV
jgi:hypothetical protein